VSKKLIDTALLQQLRVLAAVVSEKSVAGAAKRLHVTQPAVSNALARLREKTGDPLLVKVGSKTAPTARALEIARVVLPALANMSEVVATATGFKPEQAIGTVRVGMPDYLEHILAPELFSAIRNSAPKIKLVMRSCNAETVSGQLDSNDIDMGLTMTRNSPNWQLATPMFDERFVCLVPRSVAPRSNRLSLATFLGYSHAMVSFNGDMTGQIDIALNALGKQRQVVATATSFSALGELLRRAQLVACVPHPIAPRLAREFDLRTFDVPFAVSPIRICLCEARARVGESMLSWVRQQLISCINSTSELR
jgi:DNA-binding transcriptional LysR family regulator